MRPPFFIKKIFSAAIWNIETKEAVLFLTFDDGPIPEVTPSVLNLLNQYKAKATFFCIGENINKYPDIFQTIIDSGHSVGNHTFNHLNGWKTKAKKYLENINNCNLALNTKHQTLNAKPLFRPPYGRITISQYNTLLLTHQVVLWDVLSKDWKQNLTSDDCFNRIKKNARPGSIIVFHDSLKAQTRMIPALEKTLDYFSNIGYNFRSIAS